MLSQSLHEKILTAVMDFQEQGMPRVETVMNVAVDLADIDTLI